MGLSTALIESRHLRQALAQSEFASNNQVVALGSDVTVLLGRQTQHFRISGPVAANPRLGWLSFESPIVRAVLGCEVGDEVELISRSSRQTIRIVAAQPIKANLRSEALQEVQATVA